MRQERRTYSPNGIASDKPIGVRFSHEHLQKVKIMAHTQNRSLANMVRVLCIKGLEALEKEPVETT